jgi:hypothetical protein
MKKQINDIIYLAKIIHNYLAHPMNKEVREYSNILQGKLQDFKKEYSIKHDKL